MDKPKKPTRSLAMLAHCHDCAGHYVDGKIDCQVTSCPFYTWMPYRKKKPKLEWMEYNPKKKNLVKWEDCDSREISEDQIKKMQKARKKRRH